MDILLETICFHYEEQSSSSFALKDIGFSLRSGECLALIGPSGSGKSTLAQHLNGLLKPQSGAVWIDGSRFHWTAKELQFLRRRVGLVFQFPEAQIFADTVFNEVAFAARQWGINEGEIERRVENALRAVGLDPGALLNRNPLLVSGGEARLISIASLLTADPEWLILDEPTLGLDLAHRKCVGKMIRERRGKSKGVMVITHDMDLVWELCPRALVLVGGKIRYDGSTSELFLKHEITSEFLLEPPRIVRLWKALKSAGILGDTAEYPPPDTGKMSAWIAEQDASIKREICSVLQHIGELEINPE